MTVAIADDRELHCPLCDYNLRGLIDPRCPECGHRFSWDDLIDEDRRKLHWLFEQRRDRNVASFARTLAESILPRRFWTALRPTHDFSASRLLLFWALPLVMLLMVLFAGVLMPVLLSLQEHIDYREATRQKLLRDYGMLGERQLAEANASIDDYLDRHLPVPTLMEGVRGSQTMFDDPARVLLPVFLELLLLPWLTIASLKIFWITMRRAQVLWRHLLRVALYTFAPLPLLPVVVCGALIVHHLAMQLVQAKNPPIFYDPDLLALCLNLCLWYGVWLGVLTTWRLARACMLYLRLPHPIWLAILSQLVTYLALVCILANVL